MSTPSQSLLAWLLTYLVHSTVLLGLAWVASRWWLRSPAVREAVWRGALLAGLVTASLQTAGFAPEATRFAMVSARERPTEPVDAPAGHRIAPIESRSAAGPVPVAVGSGPDQSAFRWPSPSDTAAALWVGGAGLLLLGFAFRRWELARRLGIRRPIEGHPIVAELDLLLESAAVRRPVLLTVSDRLASPIAVGVSEICVPAIALRELDPKERISMLAHELAHLVRFDPIWLTVAALLERVFFFQPLNRVARRGIQADAELLCDEWAAARIGSGLTMARCLVKVAEWIDAAPRPIPIAGMAEERSHLVNRVQRLVEENPVSVKPRRRLVVGSVVAVIAITALAAPNVSLVGQRSEPAIDREPSEAEHRLAAPDGGAEVAVARLPDDGAAPVGAATVRQDTSGAVVAALAAALRDPSGAVRRAAAQSLGRLESRRATRPLIAAIDDEEPEVRRAVVEALGSIGDDAAIQPLRSRLDDVKEVRRAAIDALEHFEGGLEVATVRGWLDDGDPEVRALAARTLGDRKDRSSAGALIKLLGDRDADVRATAARALGEIGDRGAVEPLAAAIKDTDVREAAMDALDEFELEEAPSAVLEALNDQIASIRHSAAHLIGSVGDRRAVPALRGLLADENAEVREAAVEALSEIRDQAAIDALVVALKSTDPVVRKAAAEALGQKRD